MSEEEILIGNANLKKIEEILSRYEPAKRLKIFNGCEDLVYEYGKEKAIEILREHVRETGNKIRFWHSSKALDRFHNEMMNTIEKIEIVKLMDDRKVAVPENKPEN